MLFHVLLRGVAFIIGLWLTITPIFFRQKSAPRLTSPLVLPSAKHPLEISPVCLQHLADHSFLSLPCLTLITRKSADLYQQGYQSRRPSSSGRMPMAADAL